MGSVQQLATCDQCGETQGLPAHPEAHEQPKTLICAEVDCPRCPGNLRIPPGLYKSEGSRLVLVRPLVFEEIFPGGPDAEGIVEGCDRCTSVRGMRESPMVVLFDQAHPMSHDGYAAPCPCGGDFRIPAGIYDHTPDGRMKFVRPLSDADVEAGAPANFRVAWARQGDTQAIANALRALNREDLSVNELADRLEEITPSLSWLSKWLRARGDELTKNQISMIIGIVGLLWTIVPAPPEISDRQMDEIVDRVTVSVSETGPSEEEVERALRRVLGDQNRGAEDPESPSGDCAAPEPTERPQP
jgi:hypothetical protein